VDPLSLLPGLDPEGPEEAPILPARRSRIVAVATADGTFVDRSLVDAPHLQIYAVGETRTRWLGTLPQYLGRDGWRPERASPGAGAAVVATKFSKKAATLLDAVGIRPITAGGHLDEVLDRVARGTLRASPGSDAPTGSSRDREDDARNDFGRRAARASRRSRR
jgi:hypothetical protein